VKDTMEFEVKAKEKTFVEFFLQLKSILRDEDRIVEFQQKWTKDEKELQKKIGNISGTC